MRSALQLRLNQQLTMTPQLQQAIRLLQMSSLELEAEIQTTLESNFLLEQMEADETIPPEENNGEIWHSPSMHSTIKKDFLLHKCAEITLKEHLLWQMELAHFSVKDKIIATTIIDAISDEGYLLCPLSEIAESVSFEVEHHEIEAILYRIQQFEPLGIGARNLSECLNIQLNSLSIANHLMPPLKALISKHLETLGEKNYDELKHKLGLKPTQLKEIIKILMALDPRPGTQLSTKKSEYVTPDIIAFKKNNQCVIELNSDSISKVRINTHYADLIYQKKTGNSVQFFKTHLKEAKWFLKALQTRDETLLKVAHCILVEQKEFLDFGEEKMKPLSLHDIANKTGLHESTISRITTKKYILTPRGMFELKYFFSHAIASPKGTDTSTVAIRAFIKKIIAEETSQTPLSDHKIKALLLARGISIARRTVTKYREAMRIPCSNERKNLSFS